MTKKAPTEGLRLTKTIFLEMLYTLYQRDHKYFQDADTGWVASELSTNQAVFVNRTDDGGQTWEEELFFTLSPNLSLLDITFSENKTGWACGSQSGLTLNGEVIHKRNIVKEEPPTSVQLVQKSSGKASISGIYPNPFKTQTVIMIEVSETSDITLNAYNSLGQKVQEIFKGALHPGEWSFRYNDSDAGVIFFILESDGIVSSQKILRIM